MPIKSALLEGANSYYKLYEHANYLIRTPRFVGLICRLSVFQ